MKENKIEKLILDLSNRWNCSPQEAVDRLNSMNESEINKLINSMTKKFQMGGYLSNGMPIGNRMVMSKTIEVIPSKRTSSDDALKHAAQKAMEQQTQQLQKDADRLKQRMFDAQMELMDKRDNNSNLLMQKPVKAPVTNSDPKYYDGPRKPQFENGGFIDCLRNGDSVEKCKCGCDKIAKAEGGNALYPYHKGKFVQSVDSNPLYPAGDGEGQISGEIRPFGDTVTVYRTPTHIYTQTRTTDGDVFIDHSAPNGSRRYYSPESKSRGFMRNVAPSWMVDLMNGVKEKFSTDVQTKKCGGSLPKKKKNYLKKK